MPTQICPPVAALLALISVTSPLAAQASPRANGRLLPARVDTFVVSYGGSPIGRGIMGRTRIGGAQRPQLLQVYEWRSAGGDVVVDSLFSDNVSLRPLREVRLTTDTVIEVTFRDDSIHVAVRPRIGPEQRRSYSSSPEVYSSASLEALAAASPLSPGFQQDVRVYYAPPSPHGFLGIRLRVEGSERISDPSGVARDAWIVSVGTPDGGSVYWIDKATRAVLKYDTREGPATIEFRR
jgi:hypothetical protein